jgi:hypothetical protein
MKKTKKYSVGLFSVVAWIVIIVIMVAAYIF